MELKLVCNCGQKYKFDVEPVNQQMPFVVNCPVCGIDGTTFANALLSQAPPLPPPPSMVAPPRVPAATPPLPPPVSTVAPASARPMPAPRSAPGAVTPPAPAIPKYLQNNPATANNSFPLGILGAFLGAIFGVVLVVGAFKLLGFSMSLPCIAIGPIIGMCARLMYHGTDSSLGIVCAIIAFFSIGAVLLLCFGVLGALLTGFVTLTIGTALAFKVAS